MNRPEPRRRFRIPISGCEVRRNDQSVKRYKPLLSSAPGHSILNAQAFHYTNSVDTDIRKAFARIRRERSNPAVIVDIASQVRCDPALPRRSVQSARR